MPRGVPKRGTRAPGGGRKKGAKDKVPRGPRTPPTDTITARVPAWVARWFEAEAARAGKGKGVILAALAEKAARKGGAKPDAN